MKDRFTRDEEGSALILTLVVMIVSGLILASMLTFAEARIQGTVALIDEGNAAATADGAMKAAVASLQNGTFNNAVDSLCFGSAASASDTIVLSNFNGSDSAAVRCAGVPGSGAQSSPVLIGPTNKPGNSILILGNTTNDGLYVKQSFANKFKVRGSIFSHGPITSAGPGQIQVIPPLGEEAYASQMYALARGACSGTITVPTGATKKCNYADSDPRGDDPGYSLPSLPAPAPLPTCTSVSGVKTVTFTPGYYDDVDALNNLTDGSNDCSIYRFTKGTYYFDFHNGDHPTAAMTNTTGKHEWVVQPCTSLTCSIQSLLGKGSRLVAGKQNSTNPWAECIKPTEEGNDGVRFIFGGNSRLVLDGIRTSICGKYETDAVPIALQGVASGAETRYPAADARPEFNVRTLKLKNPTGGFQTMGNAASIDTDASLVSSTLPSAVEATWTNTGSGTQTQSFTSTAFAPSEATSTASAPVQTVAAIPSVPPRAVLEAFTLRVHHRNSNGKTSDTRKVSVKVGSATCDVPLAKPNGSANQKETFDLRTFAACANVISEIYTNGYSTATLKYEVTVNHKDTEKVDALQLDIAYRPYAYRAQTSAVPGDTPCNLGANFRPSYAVGGATGCAAVTFRTTVNTQFNIQGTTYMPKSALNADVDIFGAPVGLFGDGLFGVGIVSRALYVNAAIAQDLSLSALPANSYGKVDPAVLLEAYVCRGSSTCAVSGDPDLTARVTLTDPIFTTPNPGSRKVTVQSWSTKQ